MKKTGRLLISLLLSLSLLAACGSQPGGTTAATTDGSMWASTPAATETAAPEALTTEAVATEVATEAVTTEAVTTEAVTTEAATTKAAATEAVTTEAAATKESSAEQPATEAPRDNTALEAYRLAAEKLPSDYILTQNWEVSRSMGKEMLITTDSRILQVRGAGTDAMKAAESWERRIEGNGFTRTLQYQIFFSQGQVVLIRGGESFSGRQSAQAFLGSRLPLAMLEADNYRRIEWLDSDYTSIIFTDATDTEWEWLGMDCTDISEAEGVVTLEGDQIRRTLYDAVYSLEGIDYSAHVEARLEKAETELVFPDISSRQLIALGNTDAVPLLDLAACCFQTDGLTAEFLAFIQSTAAASVVLYQEWVGLDENGAGPLLYDQASQGVYSAFSSRMTDSEYRHYDGETHYTEDQKEKEPALSPEEMEEEIMAFLLENWLEVRCLRQIELSDEEDCWLLQFEIDERGAGQLFETAEALVHGERGYTKGQGGSFKPSDSIGYISIDKGSGLPIHARMDLMGNQLLRNQSGELMASFEWNYRGADPDAASTIMGTVEKGEKPEKAPTPLFYQIKAPEGGSMWLLGTIHVGDNRSSHLPQEIYDALLGADALAVEIDTSNFEERLEEDPKLLEAYQAASYYPDGSTAYDHLSEEQAKKLEKAVQKYGGSLMLETLSYNVASITSYLEQVMLPLGRLHSYERGVDNQLVELAKAHEIPVWDVEDFEAHITLLGNFSEELQALMMEETLDAGRYGSNMGAAELFDLWCQGDEAEIEKSFAEEEAEDEELTEEEKALVEEYNHGMMVKRNAEMVEKAKEYLASDKTVFFAVGLAHLMGEDGLLSSLRQAGCSVEPVSYK